MPTLKDMQLEGPEVHDKILAQIYRLDDNSKKMGLGPLDPQQLRLAYDKIKATVAQMIRQPSPSTPQRGPQAPPGFPPPTRAPAPAPNLPLSTFAEGGLVNDVTGQGTQDVRNRL